MEEVVSSLRQKFPDLRFTPGKRASWSPETKEITYTVGKGSAKAYWSLLHETGHALLGHANYQTDFELLKLEVAAWEKAKKLARELHIIIDNGHIQNCLDTYRDWLHRRSTCPECGTSSIQQTDKTHYRCFNCHAVWQVTPSKFCRAYRQLKNVPQADTFQADL